MHTFVVFGLLYTFLARVTGEPLVKIQVCGDVFNKAVSDSLGKIEESDIKNSMGGINIYEYSMYWSRGWRKGNPKLRALASSGMEFPSVKSQMLSKDIVEIEIEALAYYGDNSQNAGGPKRTAQNWMSAFISYWKSNHKQSKSVLLYLDLVVKLSFQAKSDNLDIKMQDCEVTLKEADSSNQNDDIEAKVGKQTGPLKVKLCDIARKAIQILNDIWKGSLVIDPSGKERLIVDSVLQPDSYCLAVLLNLLSNDLVEESGQKHEYMAGSGVSLLQGYFTSMINSEIHVEQLNKMLVEKDIHMTPEELNALMHDVYETDLTGINITMDPPLLNIESGTMTFTADLLGHAAKSDKAAFNSQFAIFFTMTTEKQKNRICFLVTGVEKLEIYSRSANMGTSGDVDVSNLEQYIKKLSDTYIIPSINSLNLCARIPNLISDGQVVMQGGTVQVLPK